MITLILMNQAFIETNEMTNNDTFLNYAPLIVAIIGAITLFFGLYQYRQSIIQNRSKVFLEMRNRYSNDDEFRNLFPLLEVNSIDLVKIPYKTKFRLLGFYEELAILVNSHLIREEVAFYMFAYNALRAWDSDNFWKLDYGDEQVYGSIDKESIYWSLFKDFVSQMKEIENKFQFKRNYFRV